MITAEGAEGAETEKDARAGNLWNAFTALDI
jgi:hypothetical protein